MNKEKIFPILFVSLQGRTEAIWLAHPSSSRTLLANIRTMELQKMSAIIEELHAKSTWKKLSIFVDLASRANGSHLASLSK